MNKAIIYLIIILTAYSCSSLQKKIVDLESIEYSFIGGMEGVENICLVEDSLDFYTTGCTGYIYRVSGTSRESLKVISSLKLNNYALGIDRAKDGSLYVAGSGENWSKEGGSIYRVDPELKYSHKLFGNYPGINGLKIYNSTIYFASGKMSPLNSKGSIYRFNIEGEFESPQVVVKNLKSPNGLYIDLTTRRINYTETFIGVSSVNLEGEDKRSVFGRSRMIEGFDDLTIDSNGNCFVADQPNGFFKMYNPNSNTVFYFRSLKLGVASSCKIRVEDGKEILYITEIKRSKNSRLYDGRGVVIIPIKELLKSI